MKLDNQDMPGHASTWLIKVATLIVNIHSHLVKTILLIIPPAGTNGGSLVLGYSTVQALQGKGYEPQQMDILLPFKGGDAG